jgi:predicted GH43/DUF377 family glycosyl hydrolase
MATNGRAIFLIVGACLSGCGRYAEFTLPAPAQDAAAKSFEWKQETAPMLLPGDWDSVDVLNPSIVSHAGVYYNFYSGFDGKIWHTGLAVSSDGEHWRKRGKILSPLPTSWEGGYIAANGSAIFDRGRFLYWYQAGPHDTPEIGLAESVEGESWSKTPNPVLETGPRGAWDERGVADPYVLHSGDYFYMYYLGQDRARQQRLGVARSADAAHWEKLRANPVLELGPAGTFDENGLGEPAVWQSHGRYWMLYTGRDREEIRRIGLAQSSDGVTWKKLPDAFAGTEPWDSKVICDPSVLIEGDSIRVWFGGGDVARPDENIHGRIGLARLIPHL